MAETPELADLISVENVEDLSSDWIQGEIKFLEESAKESISSTKTRPKKVELSGKRADSIAKLIRVLVRLARTKSDSRKLCEDVVAALRPQAEKPDETNSYAQALRLYIPKNEQEPTAPTSTADKQVASLSAHAPVFKPLEKNEITIVPSNYDNDVKNVEKSLSSTQVSKSRKSKNGNIVLSFPSNETMKSAKNILAGEPGIKLHVPSKSLPKMSIHNVELPDEEIRDSILSKNSQIKALVEEGCIFQLLFVQKIKDTDIRNAIFKVDPRIRECIGKNRFKIFVGLKNCTVYDRIYHKTCFNCQKIGFCMSYIWNRSL